jgi:hypothetical protein
MGGPPMGGPPMGGHGPNPGMGGPPMGPGPMGPGGPAPMPPRPHPITGAPNPYMIQKPPRPNRPVEPWKDSLRLQMFIWGGVLILAFLTPLTIEPGLTFQWDTIIDAPGIAKLDPLLIASVGLLGILLAIIPTSPPPRGLVAGLLGATGVLLSPLIHIFTGKGDFGLGTVLQLCILLSPILLVPGLLLRNEYRDSIMPRILVMIGVLLVLAAYLIPVNDKMALVQAFDILADAEGKEKVGGILELLPLLYALMSLLVWLPAPGSGIGKVTAWLWITLPALNLIVELLLGGHIGDVVKGQPYAALMSWAPISSYLVFTGYGFATVFGKQLE